MRAYLLGGFTVSSASPSGQFLACPGFLAMHSSSLSLPCASSDFPGQLSLSANLGSLHLSSVFGAGTAEALCIRAGPMTKAIAVAAITLIANVDIQNLTFIISYTLKFHKNYTILSLSIKIPILGNST